MPTSSTTVAIVIKAGELAKATIGAALRAGESRIAPAEWNAIAMWCKGEPALLIALGVVDKRTGTK